MFGSKSIYISHRNAVCLSENMESCFLKPSGNKDIDLWHSWRTPIKRKIWFGMQQNAVHVYNRKVYFRDYWTFSWESILHTRSIRTFDLWSNYIILQVIWVRKGDNVIRCTRFVYSLLIKYFEMLRHRYIKQISKMYSPYISFPSTIRTKSTEQVFPKHMQSCC